jgi:hypothetical protein
MKTRLARSQSREREWKAGTLLLSVGFSRDRDHKAGVSDEASLPVRDARAGRRCASIQGHAHKKTGPEASCGAAARGSRAPFWEPASVPWRRWRARRWVGGSQSRLHGAERRAAATATRFRSRDRPGRNPCRRVDRSIDPSEAPGSRAPVSAAARRMPACSQVRHDTTQLAEAAPGRHP